MKDLTVPDFKRIFDRLKGFAERIEKCVFKRFKNIDVFLGFAIFAPDWDFSQSHLAEAAGHMAAFWECDKKALLAQLRDMFAYRKTVLDQKPLLAKSEAAELWATVLSKAESSAATMPLAVKVVNAFLVRRQSCCLGFRV